jgi:hypothetical protein
MLAANFGLFVLGSRFLAVPDASLSIRDGAIALYKPGSANWRLRQIEHLEEIMDLVKRRTGFVSLWWCVAKWDHLTDGRSQATPCRGARIRRR